MNRMIIHFSTPSSTSSNRPSASFSGSSRRHLVRPDDHPVGASEACKTERLAEAHAMAKPCLREPDEAMATFSEIKERFYSSPAQLERYDKDVRATVKSTQRKCRKRSRFDSFLINLLGHKKPIDKLFLYLATDQLPPLPRERTQADAEERAAKLRRREASRQIQQRTEANR